MESTMRQKWLGALMALAFVFPRWLPKHGVYLREKARKKMKLKLDWSSLCSNVNNVSNYKTIKREVNKASRFCDSRCSRSGNKPTDEAESMKKDNVLQVDIEHVASGSYGQRRYEQSKEVCKNDAWVRGGYRTIAEQSRGKDASEKNRENMDKRHKYACLRGLMAHVPVIVISPSERGGTRGLPVVRKTNSTRQSLGFLKVLFHFGVIGKRAADLESVGEPSVSPPAEPLPALSGARAFARSARDSAGGTTDRHYSTIHSKPGAPAAATTTAVADSIADAVATRRCSKREPRWKSLPKEVFGGLWREKLVDVAAGRRTV
uniref:Uncharacterized protein n=1 Tax=Vespula pensylvanica TaxID=30213 RepID=A0A834P633_VESPE|nr:hypothetical protein H0235_006078 [Vespula pensylvanica]